MCSLFDSESNDSVLVGPGDIRDFNSDNILPLPAADLVKIRQWLQPTAYDLERSEYSRHRASHLVGTGKWLTSMKTYQQWHSGDNGLLWIKGIPGSGKSVIAASIIDQLRKEEVPVIYFFFRQIIDANHKPITALRDWLCQILNYSPPLQVKLKEYIDNQRSIESLSPSDIWKDLKLALESFPKAYCVTDALDEMDEGNDWFLHSLVELGQWRPSNVKFLITSRPVASVEAPLRTFPVLQIRLEERLVDLDIATYVQHKLRNSPIPKEHWNIIEESIPGRANGLFLYARLSMDAFLEPGADVHEVLKALPTDLNVMYNGLLREHAKRSNVSDEIQLLVLQFVTHATRPLRLLEIAEVMNTVHFSSGSHSLKETKELVRAACGPLLEILPDETVSVVHHSFTEFLKGFTRSNDSDDSAYPVLHSGSTNQCLAVACLNYLRSGCLDNQRVKRSDNDEFYYPKKAEQSELRLQFPFLGYAANNWYKHTRRAASAGANMSHVYDLLDTFFAEKHRYNVWLDIAWPTSTIEGVTPFHVAARTGLAQYIAHLLQTGDVGIEARDCNHNTPLYWAATHGHTEAVQVLLDNGADPDAEQNQGLRPLHQAASNNRAEVVEVLLAARVDPLTPKTRGTPGNWCGNAPTSYGHTPLMYACHYGHVKTVAKFLPFLKDVEICHRALSWAADKSRAAIVDLILHHSGVDANAKWRGDTALFRACKARDFKTIDVLLKAGADPNIFCDNAEDEFAGISCIFFDQEPRRRQEPRGFTALHSLCETNGYSKSIPSECVEVLLNAGADVHVKTPDGSTALHYACKYSTNLVKPLLEAGADPTAENDAGETPLHTDGTTDNELLPLLLGTGTVDINRPRSTDGKTPLLCRLKGMYSKSVVAFLEYKPDVNATDTEGNGALHVALNDRHIKTSVIDALLCAGADPNLKNRHGNTPFHVMKYGVDAALICRLLDAGADLEAQNLAGQTVLFTQFTSPEINKEGRPEIFEMLINQGARTDTRDYKGRTLWHHGCEKGKRLDHLRSLGLEPIVTDHEGNTPLHEVAAATSHSNKLESMKHLMGLGLEVDQPNHRGRTVLHILCSRTDYKSKSSKKDQPLDYVLGVSKNVSPSDIDGIQPLHLAATICENFVFKLLNAGADLFAVTHEGMTVLHLAARARQFGIVDMILSRLGILEEKDRMAFVNQKNCKGETALHYACRSGRPETVKSLLEAGADPNLLDNSQNSPFTMCADFENEQKLWRNDQQTCVEGLNAAGLLLKDRTRPFGDRNHRTGRHDFSQLETEHDTTRLDEIMDSLVQYGAVITGDHGCLQRAWRAVMLPQFGYTIDCILHLEARVTDAKITGNLHRDTGFLIASYCRKAEKEALKESTRPEDGEKWSESRASSAQRSLLESALAMRQYDLFEEIATDSACLIVPGYQGRTALDDLVHWGYSDILARVCSRELATKLDDHEWCREAEAADGLSRDFISPLIVSACTRQLPNMDVLKQLVEDFGVSMDAQCSERVYHGGEYQILMTTSALHYLATGNCWWHVDGALPYLIEKGANLNLRNHDGATPLHIALASTEAFCKEAAKILIKGGADVNAVDDDGNTCLSKAGNDLDLIKLLIAHGAKVSAAAIFSAINLGQVEILEVLLSQGDYANLRSPGPTKPKYDGFSWSDIVDSEMFPLFYASSFQCPKTPNLKATKARMMTILLKHGADPFAAFVKYTKKPRPHDESTEEPAPELPTKSHTIIHKILSSGHMFQPFFQIPSLDLERRDQSGRTLLLAASKNHKTLGTRIMPTQEQDTTKTVFQELIDRGANVMAQDDDGKTILHLIGNFKSDADFIETLRAVIINNPSLTHQTDRAGDTPLHYALRHRAHDYVDLLLENGADPTQPDSNGDTALHHIASQFKNRALFKRFLAAGVDINARNNQGDTPLFKYITIDFESSCRSAIFGLDLSFEHSSDGEFNDPVFKFFREAGADFFARNNAQSSLLHLLAAIKVDTIFGSKSTPLVIVERFKCLMDLGLDPMAEDARQRTSLDVAAACGSEHIQKLFERKPME
ncbi:uncharacterized protein ASPGLDRAFT_182453 [Aspergillus glaucus CBS 516.65]|uniref:Nephrocystin 3-like N-terminal domain-containing protein n=1 Tax=Aspergillus glaucus CBS 516.65 TaxID=1160497 RepID=A0A1L9V3N9_ASPGL|nr:hypothetical protein ASPGLDRAFT_182453 [Aspergillus glaucus CBS 516.65]OJJ78555.1 hypothetical protein ASPGLDRAFT_182453 [Aspergillus glaucus CBS 516.65]